MMVKVSTASRLNLLVRKLKYKFILVGRWSMIVGVLVLGLSVVAGCSDRPTSDEVKKQSEQNLQNGVVRVEIGGHRFDIPVRYMYWQGFEKHGHWPRPKEGIVKVDYITVDALLPDMRPYSEAHRKSFEMLGVGDKIHMTISYQKGHTHRNFGPPPPSSGTEAPVASDEAPGLIIYKDKGKGGLDGLIFPSTSYPIRFACFQKKNENSPLCSVTSIYKGGPILEYSYARRYISQWREIDEWVKTLFDRFEQDAKQFDERRG